MSSAIAATCASRLGQVDSFSAIRGNERAFVVTDKLRRRFRINLMYRCPGLDFNMAVGFKTLESGSLACIARGDTVISRDVTRAGDRCPISSVEPYTPAMEAADKAAAAAKPKAVRRSRPAAKKAVAKPAVKKAAAKPAAKKAAKPKAKAKTVRRVRPNKAAPAPASA